MIELALIIILSASVAGLATWLILEIRNRQVVESEASQVLLDNAFLSLKVEELSASNNIENTDGFIKFLSESRDWAFEYIETVQNGLNKFVEQAGPRLEYFDKYGRVAPSPHTEGIEDILAAYRELQKLLPEQNNKENNNE